MNEEKVSTIDENNIPEPDPMIRELKSTNLFNQPGIVQLDSWSQDASKIVKLDGTNQDPPVHQRVGSPVTEAERPIVNPMLQESTKLSSSIDGKQETVEMEKIPGVKEVTITQPLHLIGGAKSREAFSMKNFLKDALKNNFINDFIRKNNLAGIDTEAEAVLIKTKKSKLSFSQRKAVMILLSMRQRQRELLTDIGKDLLHKEDVTDEDMSRLLDSIEETSTDPKQLQETAEAALNNIGMNSDAFVQYAPMTEAYLVPSAPWITSYMLSEYYKIPIDQLKRVNGTFGSCKELDMIHGAEIGMIMHVCRLTVEDADKENYQHEYYIFTKNGWDLICPPMFEGAYTEAPKALENKADITRRQIFPDMVAKWNDTDQTLKVNVSLNDGVEAPHVFASIQNLPISSEQIIAVPELNESPEEPPKE